MDWPTASVAMAASVASASVAIWAVRSQATNAEADRQHDVEVRRKERRAAAYVELMTMAHRLMTEVERTAPIYVFGQVPEVPPVTDEEAWHLNALSEVIATDELRKLLVAWSAKRREFADAVEVLHDVQEYVRHGNGTHAAKEQFGVMPSEQWAVVEALRAEIRRQLGGIGAQVRKEL
jgi:hypothetical protein